MQSDLPPAAYNPFEWPEYYLPCVYPSRFNPVPTPTLGGAMWHQGPVTIETYRTDIEPPLAVSSRHRLIFWHRPLREDTPKGWHRTLNGGGMTYIGYHLLQQNFLERWKKRARQYARHWQRNLIHSPFKIVPLSFDEFADAFAGSTVATEIPTLELDKLRLRLTRFPTRVFLWGVKDTATGTIAAGLSAFDSPTNRASHYSCGFYLPSYRAQHLMVVLMDHWFNESLSKGFKVLHFGTFLGPGDIWKRGKNISHFKAQFVTNYILYKRPLWRFVRRKK
jgi:hypothetical protein